MGFFLNAAATAAFGLGVLLLPCCGTGDQPRGAASGSGRDAGPIFTGVPFHLEGAVCPISGGKAKTCTP